MHYHFGLWSGDLWRNISSLEKKLYSSLHESALVEYDGKRYEKVILPPTQRVDLPQVF